MIFGNQSYNRSPVESQKLIWIAEYYDGTHLAEYDLVNRKTNEFYDIDRNKLIRFGFIGSGSQAYFDVANGIFDLNRNRIMVSYIADEIEYPLTGRAIIYNDIIQFKDAIADVKPAKHKAGGRMSSTITTHAIGYKKEMDLAGVNIHFQNVLHLPLDEQTFMQIRISADKDLDGRLVFRVNGLIANEIYAPLKANSAGIVNWEL